MVNCVSLVPVRLRYPPYNFCPRLILVIPLQNGCLIPLGVQCYLCLVLSFWSRPRYRNLFQPNEIRNYSGNFPIHRCVRLGDLCYPRALANLIIIAGYCVGPLAWGPLSEQYGRRPIFLISFVFYTVRTLNFPTCDYFIYLLGAAQILQIACAVAPNGPAFLIFRFLGGCFAAAPLTNSGAILADM